jgi:hypothetical protein
MLAFSDALYSIAILLGTWKEESGICYFQAILLSYSTCVTLLQTTAIAFTLYRAVVLQHEKIETSLPYIFAYSYGVPILLAVAPISTGSYSSQPGICWLSLDEYGLLWKLL